MFTSATSLVQLVSDACPQAPVDVCFVIDGSGSLGQSGYDQERNFVVSIVNELTSSTNRYCYTIFDSGIERYDSLRFVIIVKHNNSNCD